MEDPIQSTVTLSFPHDASNTIILRPAPNLTVSFPVPPFTILLPVASVIVSSSGPQTNIRSASFVNPTVPLFISQLMASFPDVPTIILADGVFAEQLNDSF